jgi:hypothetical protein
LVRRNRLKRPSIVSLGSVWKYKFWADSASQNATNKISLRILE